MIINITPLFVLKNDTKVDTLCVVCVSVSVFVSVCLCLRLCLCVGTHMCMYICIIV